MIPPFRDGNEAGRDKLNRMVEICNAMSKIRTSGGITAHFSPDTGLVIGQIEKPTLSNPDFVDWGQIVCKGPNGETNFDDQRYWVKLVRPKNTQVLYQGTSAIPQAIEVEDVKIPFGVDGDPDDSDRSTTALQNIIVMVENLAERNYHTHLAWPGTLILFTHKLDKSIPGQWKYVTSHIDLNKTGKHCKDSSSSSSSESSDSTGDELCWFFYRIVCRENKYYFQPSNIEYNPALMGNGDNFVTIKKSKEIPDSSYVDGVWKGNRNERKMWISGGKPIDGICSDGQRPDPLPVPPPADCTDSDSSVNSDSSFDDGDCTNPVLNVFANAVGLYEKLCNGNTRKIIPFQPICGTEDSTES